MKFSQMPYERVDFDAAAARFRDLTDRFARADSGPEQFAVHREFYALCSRVDTMATLAHIRHDMDVTDKFYEGEQAYYDEKTPLLTGLIQAYQKQLWHSPFRPFLEEKIGPVAFRNMELAFRSFDDRIIGLKQEENALVSRYMDLIASARISFHGEELNLSLLGKYLTGPDRAVRQEAFMASEGWFQRATGEIDEIYDQMVKNRTQQARILGCDDFVAMGYDRMGRNCYDEKMVAAFRKQVKETLVPLTDRIHQRRAARIGVDRLRLWDEGVWFPEGNPAPTGTPEEILAAGQRMYREMSPETREFMDFMIDNALFDVLGRKNKRAGGYMTYLPDYKSPFIFANFNGTSGDADVITHECGHAFQGYLTRDEEIREFSDLGMETAEIHSMAMEFFTEPWMGLLFGDRAADYVRMHLEDAVTFLPYGCMVDEFQHIVYREPHLTPAQRKEAWAGLQREYKPYLDYGDTPFYGHGGFWQKQQHIFCDPFYYIDYCLAQVCALQYKGWMDRDRAGAWDSYLKLCRLGARKFYTDLLPAVGLKSPFASGTLEETLERLRDRL